MYTVHQSKFQSAQQIANVAPEGVYEKMLSTGSQVPGKKRKRKPNFQENLPVKRECFVGEQALNAKTSAVRATHGHSCYN